MLIAARSRPFLLLHRACGGAFSAYSYNNVRQSGWLSQEKSTLGHGIYNRKCENGSSERCILRRKVARSAHFAPHGCTHINRETGSRKKERCRARPSEKHRP